MSSEIPLPTAPVRRQSRFRRPIWILAGVVALTLLAWFGRSAWQDWADARAWEAYLAERESRDPNWRDQFYGRPETAAEAESRQRLNALNTAIYAQGRQAWIAYRTSLYGGFAQDPDRPDALMTSEQYEFLRWVRQLMKAFVEQGEQIDRLVPLNFYFDQDLPHETLITRVNADLNALCVVNEVTELQAFQEIQENHPEKAVRWVRRSLRLQNMQHYLTAWGRLGTIPYLVERLLNLTEPSDASLEALQDDLNELLASRNRFADLRTQLRLDELRLRDFRRNGGTDRDLNQYASIFLDRDSAWNSPWTKPLRSSYLHARFSSLFRRHDHILLQLNRLADRIDELVTLPPGQAWLLWNTFAQENRLPSQMTLPIPESGTPAVPAALLFLLPGLHTSVILHFNMEAHLTCTRAAIAAERFRRDSGRMPKQWPELVPRYLPQEPLDPYTRPTAVAPDDAAGDHHLLRRPGGSRRRRREV